MCVCVCGSRAITQRKREKDANTYATQLTQCAFFPCYFGGDVFGVRARAPVDGTPLLNYSIQSIYLFYMVYFANVSVITNAAFVCACARCFFVFASSFCLMSFSARFFCAALLGASLFAID